MDSIRIDHLVEYMDYIIEFSSYVRTDISCDREQLFFRGQPNADNNSLLPSLARDIIPTKNYLDFEGKMIDRIKMYYPDEFSNLRFPINLLAKMQHYGLPTRLLDVTRNALVALYFACDKDTEKDGKVFCFKIKEKDIHYSSSIYSNIAAFLYSIAGSKLKTRSLKNFAEQCSIQDFIVQKPYCQDAMTLFNARVEYYLQKPIFALPEYYTERQKRQQAAFIIFPNMICENEGAKYFSNQIESIGDNYEDLNSVIIINKERKTSILNDLELFGISEDFLFPEISHTCEKIKNQINHVVIDAKRLWNRDEKAEQ